MQRTISFTLNGKPERVTWVLRGDLGLTGTKFGCGAALCGACTVIVDQEPVCSCSIPVKEIAGKHVLTIEGLAQDGKLHRPGNAPALCGTLARSVGEAGQGAGRARRRVGLWNLQERQPHRNHGRGRRG